LRHLCQSGAFAASAIVDSDENNITCGQTGDRTPNSGFFTKGGTKVFTFSIEDNFTGLD
jgi:hypothetical protein